MCSAPNVYIFVYTLIGTQIVPLTSVILVYLHIEMSPNFDNTGLDLRHSVNAKAKIMK